MNIDRAEQYRRRHPLGIPQQKGDPYGWFVIPSPLGGNRFLDVMVAPTNPEPGESDWQHISVSLHYQKDKTPTWSEMCFVKELFFDPEEVVVQFHPKKSEYVNYAKGCLHLWRWVRGDFPTPPWWHVGPKSITTLNNDEGGPTT